MADPSTCPPVTPASIEEAYEKIKDYIHKTPLLTSKQLNAIASHPNPSAFLSNSPPPLFSSTDNTNGTNRKSSPTPKFSLYFKAESQQRIGAFKARGAFHALTRLISTLTLPIVQSRGVTTHSSGNHAQALALAAHTFSIPSYIVMPTISTPSKIAGTKLYTDNVIFSGSTSQEREDKVKEVMDRTGAILVPPYDHTDIILGQGTTGLEMEAQLREVTSNPSACFDAVISPLGGGGLLSGIATWFSHPLSSTTSTPSSNKNKKTLIFGAEPSFQGANDAQLSLSSNPPIRIPHVSSLTIADGLRTPVGLIPWSIISDKSKVQGVYSVSEREIKMALKLTMERLKLFLEPSAVVGVAVVLFCSEFREEVGRRQEEERIREEREERREWDLGVVLSGGNTTVEALAKLFGEEKEEEDGRDGEGRRVVGKVGLDRSKEVEDVAG